MPIGLDLSPYALTITSRDNDDVTTTSFYGIQGIPPKWNEPIIWNDPQAVRYTYSDRLLSLMETWWRFSQNHHAKLDFMKPTEVDPVSANAVDLLCEAMKAHIPDHAEEFTVLAVDNLLPEFQQTALLRAMGAIGFGKRELLWRPIAIALAHLSSIDSIPYKEKDLLVIVDTDTYIPEITILTLKEHRGHLVPLRDYPKLKRKPEEQPYAGYCTYNLLNDLAGSVLFEDEAVANQLLSGPFTSAFFKYLNSGSEDEIWIRKELDHQRVAASEEWRSFLRGVEISGESFHGLKEEVDRNVEKSGAVATLWNGMISRLHETEIGEYSLMPDDTISVGASEYGRRRLAGIPGYLDTLPGLKIMGKKQEGRTVDFEMLIWPGELEGGEIRRSEPRSEFSLEEETKDFTAVLNNVAEDTYRQYITQLPKVQYSGLIPLILNAEAQPGQGNAKVTIQGAEGYENAFGDIRFIELDWEKGLPFEKPTPAVYRGPEHYPVRGRIADDPDCRSVAQQFVDEDLHVGSSVRFRGRNVGYMRVHEPWGFNDPFRGQLGEPTRALFGALDEKDPEITALADSIGQMIQNKVRITKDRHKYLNYMFRYAPEGFRAELRHLFSIRNPDLNWNTVYAVGRTFYRRDDFELFLDFFLQKSQNSGFPDYPNEDFIPAYFWSFFRGLCFYEDTAAADRGKVEGVLDCIFNYSKHCSNVGWPGGRRANVIKYLLCGILFSLRLRKYHRDFLAPENDKNGGGGNGDQGGGALTAQGGSTAEMFNKMTKTITNLIPRVDYPVAMFAVVQPDKLNDYVLRFLNEKQSVEDISALHGLVISMK